MFDCSLYRTTQWWWQTSGCHGSWWTTSMKTSCRRVNCPVWRNLTAGRGTLWWETPTGWLRRWFTVRSLSHANKSFCHLNSVSAASQLLGLRGPFVFITITTQSCSFLFSGKSYDERVDIFSFGIMLCEVSDLLLSLLFVIKLFIATLLQSPQVSNFASMSRIKMLTLSLKLQIL